MDEEFLMISGIQHFVFCRRQWALIHVEQQWNENLKTVEGEILHEKCHDENFVEKRKDLLICRGMKIFSKKLNVSGQCDVVEFKQSKTGANLFGREGFWRPVPVEYKRGKPKKDLSDILQLCAQVICLEEMLCCDIGEGYLFYNEIHRREKIEITVKLRQEVFKIFAEMNGYFNRGYTPKAKYNKKCKNCSLKNLCLPKISKVSLSANITKIFWKVCKMRRMLNTLFILNEETYLAFENENVIVKKDEEILGRVPLLNLENILYFDCKGVSPALIGECAKRKIGLCFLSRHGKFLARVCGMNPGNVLLRKKQYLLSENYSESCKLARNFIVGKIFNERTVIERMKRDHPLNIDKNKFESVSKDLKILIKDAQQAEDKEILLGIEGKAASLYFSVFDDLILGNKTDFEFKTRQRRPPIGKVNALLSFAYTILAHDCASALESVRLEELSAIYADRFVLTLINNRVIKKSDFEKKENGVTLLNETAENYF